jgi:hypothetical protein
VPPGRIVTGRQGVISAKDAQRVVYPHGVALAYLQAREEKQPLPPLIEFRSRLEADWANTLDRLKIKWSYEPQLFTLPNGQRYLPDFWLEELSTWLEVKGPGISGLDKTVSFAQWREDCLVIAGYSPALIPRRGFRARFQGVTEQAGLALCPDCHRFQWITPILTCRACGAIVPRDNFYRHDSAPFHPAPWAGD